MQKVIYTIGYSGFTVNDFINVLKKYEITSVIDVRSNPNSRFHPSYNKENLERILKLNRIVYRNYKEFGARQEDRRYYKKGYLDFNEYTQSDAFLHGVRKVEIGMTRNYVVVLMCAEKDPSMCHRSIMIGRKFHELGYIVKNILADGSYELQESIERRLVEQYFPNRNQIALFSENYSWEQMVKKSYEYRNAEIGYRIDDNEVAVLWSR